MAAWVAAISMVLGGAAVAGAEPAKPEARYTIVAFLGVECPMAKLAATRLNELHAEYAARGVEFLAYDPNSQDTADEIRQFVETHRLAFPMRSDVDGATARRYDVTRTPTVVVVDAAERVLYRGQVDDQFAVGSQKSSAGVHYLRDALDDLLTGRDPRRAETDQVGCAVHFKPVHLSDLNSLTAPGECKLSEDELAARRDEAVTFAKDVEPILRRHCVVCHQPGAVGPMSLITFDQARGWAKMIDEVVADGRMPPWKAKPSHGPFVGQTTLDHVERATLRRWVREGCLAGDLAIVSPPPPKADDGWTIGRPDAVIKLPEPQVIPPTGIVEYRFLEVDPGFTTDRWVSAIEVRPTDREVLHHCNIFLKPAGSDDAVETGSLGSVCLAAMAAGTPPVTFLPGMAKRIPAGWRMLFVMHYVTVGTERRDQTELGLKFVEPETVEREVATRLLVDEHLEIPPHAADHRVAHETRVEHDLWLLAMFPHMHLRGKSFEYEAEYPDGRRETLLSIPQWDFGWQYRYELTEPKRLPAGTIVRATAVYDNSAANPANPDPSATVRTGPTSDDEMFNGYFDVAYAEPEYPTRMPWYRKLARGMALGLGVLALVLKLRAKRKPAKSS